MGLNLVHFYSVGKENRVWSSVSAVYDGMFKYASEENVQEAESGL